MVSAAVGAFGDEAGDDADFAAEELFRGDAAGGDWGAAGWRGVAWGWRGVALGRWGVALEGNAWGGAGGDEGAEQRSERAEQGQGCGETHAVWVLFCLGKSRYASGLWREGERSGFWREIGARGLEEARRRGGDAVGVACGGRAAYFMVK